jgi:hypothetical protein
MRVYLWIRQDIVLDAEHCLACIAKRDEQETPKQLSRHSPEQSFRRVVGRVMDKC